MRISVGEWAAAFLSHHVGSSSENPPPTGVTLELVETFQTANLARREADLAVRHYPPESGDLYISKLGVFAGAIYRRIGSEARDWVTYPEEQGHFPMPRWVEQRVRETGASVALRASDMPMHLTAIRAGAGRGILPCFIADGDPLLERVAPPVPETSCDYWLKSTATCGAPRVCERLWIGSNPFSEANATASPVLVERQTFIPVSFERGRERSRFCW